MSGVRARVANRLRSNSLNVVAPRPESEDYNTDLARAAVSILYQSPIPSKENRPVYILNAAALPDTHDTDFDALLPYVLARLPEEDELLKGFEYEVVFFAGDGDGSVTSKKHRPGWGWFLQAYHVLSRAMRKRLQRLYIVHEKAWVRILTEIFSTIVSPKFKRKIFHASSLSNLALQIPIEDLLIPPSTYLNDRRISNDIFAPYATGRRAFAVRQPLPVGSEGKTRLPRILRETTNFVLMEENVVQEGLFRVPPHAKLKEVLKEAYDRGQKFIVWKDNGATLSLPPYPRAEHQDEIIAEVDQRDAYSVLMAAGLIKSWYSDLRQPIFPQASYRELKRLYGDPDDLPDLERLKDLVSPTSEWSFLPAISREIMVRHLLPLMDAVTARQEQNKMTPENLAVCIAPALLCGPDQLEDAKMSSIIRRIMTEAIDLWSQGLREACGVDANAFKEDLRLPKDIEQWDDPVEGRTYRPENSNDESQVTGIILQDNEQSPPDLPPPLPPRSTQPPQASGVAAIESFTRRKPAPPLAVPPRYSTIVSEGSHDVAESPASYAAVTDGFAPPKSSEWDSTNEKKSGTNTTGDSHPNPQIILPKRKALTAEQIERAESATAEIQARKLSDSRMALPGLTNIEVKDLAKRKGIPSPKDSVVAKSLSDSTVVASPEDTTPPARILKSQQTPAPEFRQPGLPASATRAPTITSLARPVYPTTTNHIVNRPLSKSATLPIPGPKPRTPSPSLLQRMPSFESSKSPPALAPPITPRRLNMKKASVDNLRRLYEERTGTAKTLVEIGRQKS